MKSIFDMSFDERCKDFNRQTAGHSLIKTGTTPMLSLPWPHDDMSTNDVLRRWLNENKIPYINTFNGDVWFSRDGETWASTVRHVENDMIYFYLAH